MNLIENKNLNNFFVSFFVVKVCLIVSAVQSEVDVDRLYHANPPELSPNRQQAPAHNQKPIHEPSNNAITDLFDDFNPYRGSRHDEFDWALTKVKNDLLQYHYLFLISFKKLFHCRKC